MSPSGAAVPSSTAAELWSLEGRRAMRDASVVDEKMDVVKKQVADLRLQLEDLQKQKNRLLEGVEQCNEASAWYRLKGEVPWLKAQELEVKRVITGTEG